jgi:hypothetical protein
VTELIVAEAVPSTSVPMRLVDGDRVLHLDPENGYSRASLDIGFPTVRAVSQGRPDADGEDDTTQHHGAAAVTLELLLVPRPRIGRTLTGLLDALRPFCHPAARPYLEVERDGTQWRIRLRAEQGSAPLTSPGHQKVQLGWRAPDGVMESLAEEMGTADAVPTDEGGFAFDLAFDLIFPASSAVGSVTVFNRGSTAVRPLLRLYGPCTDPRVENQTTGERLVFTGLTIAAGDWLEIDCRDSTARLNGLASQSRLSRLDFNVSDFLRLLSGSNTLRYYPVAFSDGARLEVRYRSARLGG